MALIKPSTSPPKAGSKEIIEEFLGSDLTTCVVDMEGFDRTLDSTYVALRSYLIKRPDLHISVSIQDGQITLKKES